MWCQLLIGATGSGILSSLDEAATWEEAKETLLTRLDIGSVRDEAWATMKNLEKGTKDIIELAGEAEKLAKRLHSRDEEATERHAVDAFLGSLEKTLAAEVQKPGHWTMEDVVAARRTVRLQGRTSHQHHARSNPAPTEGPQGRQRSDRSSQNQCPNRSHHGRCSRTYHNSRCRRSSTACRSRSPHLPGLQRETQFLPPSPPSDGSLPTTLLPMRRRRALHVQLSCLPSPSTPPLSTSTRQRPQSASRTNSGTAEQREQLPPQL